MMKAVRLVAVNQPLQEMNVATPLVGDRDVIVRVKAAGVCHSDVHYRAGTSPVEPLPLTLGHEVAGVVAAVGRAVEDLRIGDRVCLHYLITCGNCYYCSAGHEQFCPRGKMIGHHTDGGFAEFIAVPAKNAVKLPDSISFDASRRSMPAPRRPPSTRCENLASRPAKRSRSSALAASACRRCNSPGRSGLSKFTPWT